MPLAESLLVLALLMPPQGEPVGTMGYAVPSAVKMSGQQEPTKRQHLDTALVITSLTASAIATGLTASCTAERTCTELNPIMRHWIGESITKAVVLKSAINGAVHFLVLRFVPEGKVRTIALGVVAGLNLWDAAHDIREMRRITAAKR